MIHSISSRSGKNTEKCIVIIKQNAIFESGSSLVRPMKPFCADPNEIDIIVKTIARDAYPVSFSIRMKVGLVADVTVFPCRQLCRCDTRVEIYSISLSPQCLAARSFVGKYESKLHVCKKYAVRSIV